MAAHLPALNLVAQPGQRLAALDLAREIERRGFAGISVSSQYSNMAQCLGLAFATERIPFATAIAPIYAQTAEEFAHGAIAESATWDSGQRSYLQVSRLPRIPQHRFLWPARYF